MKRDEKNALFERWFSNYIRTHDVDNAAKKKEIARWAFWAGVEAVEHSVQRTCCKTCGKTVKETDTICSRCGTRNPTSR